jgi:arylsulfatase A-like enzyme/Flp pilus assembly protein TadD
MRRTATAVGASLLFVLCAACRREPPAPTAPATARHLLLVTIDTLRADRLGCYGNARVETPHLDALARAGALAEAATVHVPLTRPSHASLLTGLLPAEHGLRDNVSPPLRPGVATLATVLAGAGFRTGGFVSSIVLSRQSGLDRGFQTYSDRFEAGGDDARFLNTIQKPGPEVVREAGAWLRDAAPSRTFTWVHLYEPHDPYEPPEPFASRYADRPYDGEVAWTDVLVGRLLADLEASGRRGDTTVIVTSDHGEGLGDHGESAHGYFVYESTLQVPFLAAGPGIVAGTRVSSLVRTIDLLPTALELLGLAPPAAPVSGRSVAPALRGSALSDLPAFAESLLPLLHYGWSDLRAVRDGRWKYIQAPRPELYDLREDPGETRDLAAAQPARAEALRAALARRLEEERRQPAVTGEVPAELLEKLGALGYLGAGAPAAGPGAGADPKDKLEEFKVLNRLMREALVLLRKKDYAQSAARLLDMRRRGIDSFEVHYYRGRALAGLGRHREAAAEFADAVRLLPAHAAAHLERAESLASSGDLEGALGAVREGQAASPKDVRLRAAEARLWRLRKRPREALAAYEAALPLALQDALLRVQAGEAARDAGDVDRAIVLLREATALSPGTASYWNSLGMALGGKGDLAGAAEAFRKAIHGDPTSAQYAYNLGLALRRQGRETEAVREFQRALQLDPGFTAARRQLAGR